MRLFFWLKIVRATRLASELLYLGRLSGRCEPGKREASADHRSPLYSLANGTARVSAVAVIHTVSLRLQKTGIFNREWFSRELVHQGEAATAPGLLSSGAGYRKQESRPSFGLQPPPLPKAAPLLIHRRSSTGWAWFLGDLTKWPTFKQWQFIDLGNACSAHTRVALYSCALGHTQDAWTMYKPALINLWREATSYLLLWRSN